MTALADPWAERGLLGACLWRPPNIEVCVDAGLEPGHHYFAAHRRQYGQLWEAWLEGKDPDPGLAKDGITGPAYDAPQVSAPLEYVAVILDLFRRRQLVDEAHGRRRPFLSWEAWFAAR